jgi:hypothetical protein
MGRGFLFHQHKYYVLVPSIDFIFPKQIKTSKCHVDFYPSYIIIT